MRATGFLITASIFSSVFLALAFVGAVISDTLQTTFGARPALTVRMPNLVTRLIGTSAFVGG